MTPLDEFMAKDRNSYMVPVGEWRPQTTQYKEAYDDYKRWADNPAGSEWWGRCANATSEVAAKDCHNSDHTDDTTEDAVRLITATITYEVVEPLTAGQNLIERVLARKNQGVSIDQTYHVTYTAPEGMSEAQAAKNTKEAEEAERQIKEYVAKWEKGCQTLKTQADAAAQKITDRTNPATVLVDGRKVLRDAVGPVPAARPGVETVVGGKPVSELLPGINPRQVDPAATTAQTASTATPTDPSKLLEQSLPKPAADQKPVYDPKSLGSLGSVTGFLEANKKPDAKPADQPAPQQKGFIDGWVDEAKKTASGIVEHAGDLVGLHGADKAKDAWIQTATGMGMQLAEQDPTFGPAIRNYENQVEAVNNAAETIQHPEDTMRRVGAQTFDFQAKLGADALALGTGGIGRVAEGGILEGALAEGRAGLSEAAVPTLRGAVTDSVKGFLDDAMHPHIEAPAAPHVETPSLPRVETPVAPHVEAPAAPHVETPPPPQADVPTTPHTEAPAPHTEVPAAPRAEVPAAPHVEAPAAPRAEVPVAPHVEGPATPHAEVPSAPQLDGVPVAPHVEAPAAPDAEAPAPAPHQPEPNVGTSHPEPNTGHQPPPTSGGDHSAGSGDHTPAHTDSDSGSRLPAHGEPDSFGYDADGNRLRYANDRPDYGAGQEETVWNNSRDDQLARIDAGQLDLPRPGPNQQWVELHPQGPIGDDWTVQNGHRLIEWEPGDSRRGLWDMGHGRGLEYRDLRQLYLNGDISFEEFMSRYRDPGNYRVEDPYRNQSHIDEGP
ncbi:Uncharacterised protein [Mycobacteroides abscessus subsp. massiliense]|uniref:HNH/ENDO VII family nuclease n=1 Tax=Mycobacteroides abscessus TaxID=36809 RepID=UPI0009A564A0|nr:HNH/ENDO VII family nuclease [Mycobacteroides abscessus]SKM80615.1 Uncharacterised protein [Mycobacteroides abscessus subsp. massiliense]SKM96917.1 Uncharacterised protein [Mycobacteroides abscessus subsp. massiliense]SKN75909.1 Uncharacterised protein [Mycobacteroides abscessus subsp. massiliense]SKN97339.1 Uncharacterised protein [Mycobacteroides abscessus subsp. massiliense]SKO20541.1 Uncharacterised protein [Mycobacteroides abscessus subsp. massiliense]